MSSKINHSRYYSGSLEDLLLRFRSDHIDKHFMSAFYDSGKLIVHPSQSFALSLAGTYSSVT